MSGTVTVVVKLGKPYAKRFVFRGPATCVVGRGDDCDLQVGGIGTNRLLSRHHCLLDIDPPHVRVRDLGSLNGTFVNGKKIGQRRSSETVEEAAKMEQPECPLTDGDEVWIGTTVLGIEIRTEAEIDRTSLLGSGDTCKAALMS
jgi:pSer/pThr/pTyr-binding forkhead associated (FHA) protein